MKKIIVSTLIFAFLNLGVSPLILAQSATENESYREGLFDGRIAAGEDLSPLGEGAWGFLLGPLALLHRYVFKPQVPRDRAQNIGSSTPEYEEGYRKGYEEEKLQKSLIYRSAGWGSWLVVWFVGFSSR